MRTINPPLRLMTAVGFMLLLSSGIFAQNNRGRNDRDRRYNNHYNAPRTRVTVGIGLTPYYNYRPAYRPRIYYRPSYRLPYRYNHYGPAIGVRINVLPIGYSRFYIGNNPFYYYDGVYYRSYKTGGYSVAPPPLGAIVKHLPSGAKTTVIDGQKYYVLGGTFYQERVTADNKNRYEVVGTDGVLNTTNADPADDETVLPTAPVKEAVKTTIAESTGTIVSQLPVGCKLVLINGDKFYISPAGVYYQEMIDANNLVSYKVAGAAANDAP